VLEDTASKQALKSKLWTERARKMKLINMCEKRRGEGQKRGEGRLYMVESVNFSKFHSQDAIVKLLQGHQAPLICPVLVPNPSDVYPSNYQRMEPD